MRYVLYCPACLWGIEGPAGLPNRCPQCHQSGIYFLCGDPVEVEYAVKIRRICIEKEEQEKSASKIKEIT